MNIMTCCTPVPLDPMYRIGHMAFDGCHYFATLRDQCAVLRLDRCWHIVSKTDTCRRYECICYDWKECCFWASSRECGDRIYRLDSRLREIDRLCLRGLCQAGAVTGIACRGCGTTLLVSFLDRIVEVEKDSGCAAVRYGPAARGEPWICGVCALCGACLVLTRKGCVHSLTALDARFRPIRCTAFESLWLPQTILCDPCRLCAEHPGLDILMFKHRQYPYLCRCRIPVECRPCPVCREYGRKCRSPEPPCCSGCGTDLIESIALVEASIAHILNAEGEKLQKVLEGDHSLEEILCVNRHVNDTLISAANLEQVLYAKLHALSGCGAGTCGGCRCE